MAASVNFTPEAARDTPRPFLRRPEVEASGRGQRRARKWARERRGRGGGGSGPAAGAMGSGGGASAARPALIWLSSDDDDDGANDAVQLVEAIGTPKGAPGREGPTAAARPVHPVPLAAASRPPGDKPPACEEDSEVLVTFCRDADVLPHARHDCPAHAFQRTERETTQPVGSNADSCPKCFCYVCDKPVTECLSWTTPTQCHCNAHGRSQYWKAERNQELCGILTTFYLEPSEIDVHLRRGGQRLQCFIPELSAAYSHYLCGTPPSDRLQCISQPPLSKRQCPEAPEHRYSEVFRVASLFVDEAKKEHPKASAVMLLGVFRELSVHSDPSKTSPKPESLECLKVAVPVLMDRITQHLQRLLVVGGLAQPLCEKLTRFFYSVPLPPHCSRFFTSLNIMPWDHRVLTTILRGQNLAGPQKQRGRGSTFSEHFPVIRARVDCLESAGR
ncbi:uncharacterized protein LOC126001571 [Suncus etruscus]|uniref:uncharacterized protein LOC126001571 n=1 Tax=Suncus etruscus TaxID=109475 RepID=UPI002110E3BA|nr:uncharacterized protein LOC126001571 [Suncus etruscus]